MREHHRRSIGPLVRTGGPVIAVVALTLLATVGYLELVAIVVESGG